MADWTMVRLEELAANEKSAISKPYGSAILKEDYRHHGVPVVRGVNLARGIFHDDDFVFIEERLADRMPGAEMKAGDLVVTHRGTVGQVSMIPRRSSFERYVASTSHVKVRLDSRKALPEFYYYWFSSPVGKQSILENASTVGVPGIAQPVATVKRLRVPHPPMRVQRGIAEVLGALDDKIEANDRVYGLADELCAAEVRNAAASGVLRRLRDVLVLSYGKALPASQRVPGDVAVYGSGGRTGTHDTALVDHPGVVIGRKGTVGAVYWADGPHFPIDTTYFVEPMQPGFDEILHYLLRSMQLSELNSDSAVPGLNRDEAYSQQVRVPTEDSSVALGLTLRRCFAWMRSVREESNKLATTRDELLPLLMSGKVRVRDVEKVVGEVM